MRLQGWVVYGSMRDMSDELEGKPLQLQTREGGSVFTFAFTNVSLLIQDF